MANTGDSFIVELTPSQLGWGTERYTAFRDIRYGEGYLSIPQTYAVQFSLYNSNHTTGYDIPGQNIFHCISSYGLLNCKLKSQGCVSAGDKYVTHLDAVKQSILYDSKIVKKGVRGI